MANLDAADLIICAATCLVEPIRYYLQEQGLGRSFGEVSRRTVILNPLFDLRDGNPLAKAFDEFICKYAYSCVVLGVDTERANFRKLICDIKSTQVDIKKQEDKREKLKWRTEKWTEITNKLSELRSKLTDLDDTLHQPAFRRLKEAIDHYGKGAVFNDLLNPQKSRKRRGGEDSVLFPQLGNNRQPEYGPICTIQLAARGWGFYIRTSGVDMESIMLSHSTDSAILRLQKIRSLLKDRNVFKVLSNTDSDKYPLLYQFKIDLVGWIEINKLAMKLGFPKLGPIGSDPQGLKAMAGECGVLMKKFDPSSNFATANPSDDLIKYALLDAVVSSDIASMMLTCNRKCMDLEIWTRHILKIDVIEVAGWNVKHRPGSPPPQNAIVDSNYKDYESAEVQRGVLTHYKRQHKKIRMAKEEQGTMLSKVHSLRNNLEEIIQSADKNFFYKALHNVLQKYIPASKPKFMSQICTGEENELFGYHLITAGVKLHHFPLGLNIFEEEFSVPISPFCCSKHPFNAARGLHMNKAAEQWAHSALANIIHHFKDVSNDSQIQHLLLE